MQPCYAIDHAGHKNRHTRHIYRPIVDDLQAVLLLLHPQAADLFNQCVVEQLYHGVNIRDHTPHQVNRPAFQRFRHNRMVRIVEDPLADSQSLVKVDIFLVHQLAHQLRDRQHRMGIVELDRHIIT